MTFKLPFAQPVIDIFVVANFKIFIKKLYVA